MFDTAEEIQKQPSITRSTGGELLLSISMVEMRCGHGGVMKGKAPRKFTSDGTSQFNDEIDSWMPNRRSWHFLTDLNISSPNDLTDSYIRFGVKEPDENVRNPD